MSTSKSNFLNLNWADFGKGLLVAVAVVVITGAYTLIGSKPGYYGSAEEWAIILHSGVFAALGYLVKNLFSNSGGEIGSEK